MPDSAAEAAETAQPLSSLSCSSVQAQGHLTELLDEGSFVPVTPFVQDEVEAGLSASMQPGDHFMPSARECY